MTETSSKPSGGANHEHEPPPAHDSDKLSVTVRTLSHDECVAILARHHIGHVGISFHDLLRVKICNYIYSEQWIYARAEMDEDFVMAKHHPWAALEVAEIDGIFDWRSVEVRGAIEFLSSSMESQDWFEFENAVRLLRSVMPELLSADDPLPQRTQLLRVHLDNLVGRESHANSPRTLPSP